MLIYLQYDAHKQTVPESGPISCIYITDAREYGLVFSICVTNTIGYGPVSCICINDTLESGSVSCIPYTITTQYVSCNFKELYELRNLPKKAVSEVKSIEIMASLLTIYIISTGRYLK